MDNLIMWLFTKDVISYLPKYFIEEKLKFDQVKTFKLAINLNTEIFNLF